MVRARHYPTADRTSQWFGSGNARMPRIDKLVLHTTETAGGWPGYGGGAIAPNFTYEPWRHQWRQHLPVDGSARTLLDSDRTEVRENRDNVVQVEISCYCDPAMRSRGHFVTDLDERALADLGAFAGWLHTEWGLPLRLAPQWLPYPASAGRSPVRMSGPEFDAFRGICGHQHVSGNDHGDPGALDVQAILRWAQSGQEPGDVANAELPRPSWSLQHWLAGDPVTVKAVEAELLRRGLLRPGPWAADGKAGTETTAAIRRYQRQIGDERFADGQFGPRQWQQFWTVDA